VQKYGLNNFAFLLIHEIDNFGPGDNQRLLRVETTYISRYGDYNVAPEAGNTLGFVHTRETRAAMQANYSQRRREAIGALNRGKKLSPETVDLLRRAALKRAPMSEETRAKVSAHSTKAMFYELSPLNSHKLTILGERIVLRTITTVADFCQCSEKTVRRALKGNGIIKGKWLIKPLGAR